MSVYEKVKSGVAGFSGEFTANDAVNAISDVKPGSVRGYVSILFKEGFIKQVRKEGRTIYYTVAEQAKQPSKESKPKVKPESIVSEKAIPRVIKNPYKAHFDDTPIIEDDALPIDEGSWAESLGIARQILSENTGFDDDFDYSMVMRTI